MTAKAVAFDMDGTLYSSEPLIEKVYADSIHEYNNLYGKSLISPSFKQIEKLIGQPVREIYLNLFQGITEEEMEQLGKIIGREFKSAILNYGGKLFDGVIELFDYLKKNQFLILLASNGKREYLQSIIDKFGLKIEPFVCVGEGKIQTKGQILQHYLSYYQIKPENLIMVGDRDSDYKAAKEAGAYFIGCNFGHGEAHEIAKADDLVSDLFQINHSIQKWQSNHLK